MGNKKGSVKEIGGSGRRNWRVFFGVFTLALETIGRCFANSVIIVVVIGIGIEDFLRTCTGWCPRRYRFIVFRRLLQGFLANYIIIIIL